jgi:hypothetical protein
MDLVKLFPKSTKRKQDEKYINLFYITMVEWGWSYTHLIETPIPVLNLLLKKHKEIKEAEKRANKKKR